MPGQEIPSRSESSWENVAREHKEREEWTAARLAADIADAIRFYRLHLERYGLAPNREGG